MKSAASHSKGRGEQDELFPGWPPALRCDKLTVKKGERIYAEGEKPAFVYKVLAGAVRGLKLLPDGRRQIVVFHLPGDVFGLDETGSRRSMAKEAVTQTELLVVKRRAVEHLAMRDTWIGRQLRRLLARNLEQAREHILLLGRKTATERVRDFLAEMDRRLPAEVDRLPMSRLDIADYLGVTIETVSRTISQLKAEGVVVRPGPIISLSCGPRPRHS